MSETLPPLPPSGFAKRYYCNKCGHFGDEGPAHFKPQLTSESPPREPCNYSAGLQPQYTAEQMQAYATAALAQPQAPSVPAARAYGIAYSDSGAIITVHKFAEDAAEAAKRVGGTAHVVPLFAAPAGAVKALRELVALLELEHFTEQFTPGTQDPDYQAAMREIRHRKLAAWDAARAALAAAPVGLAAKAATEQDAAQQEGKDAN